MTALLIAVACGGADAANAGIETTYALTKTTYLSTEPALERLTVVNHTSVPAEIAPTSVVFTTYTGALIRSWMMACSANCMWRFRVAPGARGVMTVDLPSCRVLSDPCAMQIGMTYWIDSGGRSQKYWVKIPPYRFIPDPSVTYKDVPDGLPVYAALGRTGETQTVSPDTVLIAVTAAPTRAPRPYDPTPFVAQVVKVLKDDGVVIDHTNAGLDNANAWTSIGGSSYDRGYERRAPISNDDPLATWRAQIYVKNAARQSDAIHRGIDDLHRHFGAGIDKVTVRFVFNARTEYPDRWKSAQDDAHTLAERLVATLDGGDLNFFTHSQTVADISNGDIWPIPSDNDELGYEGTVLLRPATAGMPVSLRFSELVSWVGSQAAVFRPNPAMARLAARAFRQSDASVPPVGTAVTIAADRPELYATGASWSAQSLHLGLSPYFVALVNARDNAAAFAKVLGVDLSRESLFAIYSRPDDDTQSVGIATRFHGGASQQHWLAMPADSGVNVYEWSDPLRLTIVPIGLEDDASTITEMSGGNPRWSIGFYRLAVEIDSSTDYVSLKTQSLLARVKSMAHVVLAAVKIDEGGKKARYEAVLNTQDRAVLGNVVAELQKAYAPFRPHISFQLTPYAKDCAAAEARVLKATVRANWWRARQVASSSHRKLRALVLAAVTPVTNEGDTCGQLARLTEQLPSPDLGGMQGVRSSLWMDVSSLMIFRTAPASR